MTTFRWNDWNRDKLAKHGVFVDEAERIVRGAKRPYPMRNAGGRWLSVGRGRGDRVVEVVHLIDADGTVFVIHPMPLSTRRRRG